MWDLPHACLIPRASRRPQGRRLRGPITGVWSRHARVWWQHGGAKGVVVPHAVQIVRPRFLNLTWQQRGSQSLWQSRLRIQNPIFSFLHLRADFLAGLQIQTCILSGLQIQTCSCAARNYITPWNKVCSLKLALHVVRNCTPAQQAVVHVATATKQV